MNGHVTPLMHGTCYNLFLRGLRLSRQGSATPATFPWSYYSLSGQIKPGSIYTTALFGADFPYRF